MDDPRGTNVYYIWYGNWSHDTAAQTILTDFMKHIGGTAYFNINTSYYDYNKEGEKVPVVDRVNYKGSITDNYSFGTALTDDDVGFIIQNAVTSGKLPADPNGQYFVLTSAMDETSGLCTVYCAFHGYQPVALPNVDNLIGSFVGNVDRCPDTCAFESQLPTPNNSVVADGMVDSIAHELSESVTDPLGTGWVNANGTENGDLCNLSLGKTKFLPNGSYYNVKFGKRPYLIQEIWVNARGGYCALALDE